MDERRLQALYRRILARDPLASEELFSEVANWLIRSVRRRWHHLDETLVWDAVMDTLLDLWRHPERYRPEMGSLRSYLVMSAQGDCRNRLKQEERQWPKHVVPLSGADSEENGNIPLEARLPDPAPGPAEQVEDAEEAKGLMRFILERVPFTDQERQVFDLILQRERRVSQFAVVLGVTHLSLAEQQHQVKRCKDRILKRVRRVLQKHSGRTNL
jgi:RNA polymerase sigma factor (sigma-70 family)